jgi:hypothetical protein
MSTKRLVYDLRYQQRQQRRDRQRRVRPVATRRVHVHPADRAELVLVALEHRSCSPHSSHRPLRMARPRTATNNSTFTSRAWLWSGGPRACLWRLTTSRDFCISFSSGGCERATSSALICVLGSEGSTSASMRIINLL